MDVLQQIIFLLDNNRLKEALEKANSLIEQSPDDAEALFTRGKIYWRMGNRSAATSDYAASARLCPGGPASRALEQSRDIEAFYNRDLYNP